MLLAHTGLVISDDPEGPQRIIATYADKKKTWEKANKNMPPASKPRVQNTTS